MLVDIDVIIEASPADFPFCEDVSLDRKWTQGGVIKLFKQLSSRAPDTAENAPIVEIHEQLDDRRVYIGKAVEDAVAQSPEKPALDDANRRLDFRLLSSPGLQVVLTLNRV